MATQVVDDEDDVEEVKQIRGNKWMQEHLPARIINEVWRAAVQSTINRWFAGRRKGRNLK